MAGPVNPTYKPGYLGTNVIDGTTYKVMGWKAKDNVATWDASPTGDAGWSTTERALRTTEFTYSMAVPSTGMPAFQVGNIYSAKFTIDGTIAYEGNVLISDRSPNVDLKGGVTLDVTAVNHGAMTGTMADGTSGGGGGGGA